MAKTKYDIGQQIVATVIDTHEIPCDICKGDGKYIIESIDRYSVEENCRECDGKGYQTVESKLQVHGTIRNIRVDIDTAGNIVNYYTIDSNDGISYKNVLECDISKN